MAFLFPAQSKADAAQRVEELKQRYPDARHHCWAYIIGDPEQALAAGFNDDGEPSGTAGKPMLNVLMQRKVGNVVAVVVRYFGGIKLGAGGLTRAYGAAVSGAVDNAKLTLLQPKSTLCITVPFALEERVRSLLTKAGAEDITAQYISEVTLSAQCEQRLDTELAEAITNATGAQAKVKITSGHL